MARVKKQNPQIDYQSPYYGTYEQERLRRQRERTAAKRRLAMATAAEKKKDAEAAKRKRAREKRAAEKGFVSVSKKLVSALPIGMRKICVDVIEDPKLSVGIEAMNEREFPNPLAAVFAGIAMHDPARAYFDQELDALFETQRFSDTVYDEVIVGGGLHAAIYCAVRVANGHPMPLVLERRRAGGVFAVSKQPSFYLNSRNRPGDLSLPGQSGSLNVLPGSPLQISDIGGSEYQTNAQLAWVIRATLAMSARVVTGRTVRSIETYFTKADYNQSRRYRLILDNGDVVRASRVVIATGLNEPKVTIVGDGGDRTMSFDQMMTQMDQTFPLKGLKRVAVIGAGDSGKTTIEALTGQGPSTGWSVASLDWLEQIDWYGQTYNNRVDFESCNRSRYKGIGRLLSGFGGTVRNGRVTAIPERVGAIARGYDCVYVNESPYDHVVVCTGYKGGLQIPVEDFPTGFVAPSDRIIAKKSAYETYVVGPAAEIGANAFESQKIGQDRIKENSTALFRYAGRTALLAEMLK